MMARSIGRIAIVAVTLAFLLMVGAAQATTVRTAGPFDVTFYHNTETDGYSTGGQNWTTEQMDDVAASIDEWDRFISNTPGRQIELHIFWYGFSGSILGGSSSPSNGDGTTSWNYGEHVWRDGINYSGLFTGYDTSIRLDIDAAGFGWNFGDDTTGAGDIDFRSVVTHELGHSLGFSDTLDYASPYWFDDWGFTLDPTGDVGFTGLSQWDQNLVDSGDNRPENGTTGDPGNFNQTDDPVYWDGANAYAFNGGLVPIYAPNPYAGGSSLSHLDQGTFPDALMSPFVSTGPATREPTPLEWAMMMDMGWEIAIPEPISLIFFGTGLIGVFGFVARRKMQNYERNRQ